MPVGKTARRILGPERFKRVGHVYRSIFVDLDAVAETMVHHLPDAAHVLDVGGGDGAPLNPLLERRPDVSVTMIDLAADIGSAVDARHASRVHRRPTTSIRDYMSGEHRRPDAILVSDVVHHVPITERAKFLDDLRDLARADGTKVIVLKDIEPGGFRARLSLWADRYISGDPGVSLVSRETLHALLFASFGPVPIVETTLFQRDRPNYSLVVRLAPVTRP